MANVVSMFDSDFLLKVFLKRLIRIDPQTRVVSFGATQHKHGAHRQECLPCHVLVCSVGHVHRHGIRPKLCPVH